MVAEFGGVAFVGGLDREQRIPARAVGLLHHAPCNRIDCVPFDLFATARTIGVAGACIEEPKVIVDLSRCGDGRARISGGVLLADGDWRRQSEDLVHVRLLHALKELARIGRQGLDVAALTFGINGVEDEGRFA